jgi:anti-sigma-K factor RskA
VSNEHSRVRDLLGPYLLGALEPAEVREVEEHLEACDECRDEAHGLRSAHERLVDLANTSEEPPPDLKDRVMAGMPSRLSHRVPLLAAAAAALCVLAVLGVLYSTGMLGREEVAAAELEPTQLAPEAGGELRVSEDDPNARAELEVWGMPRCEEDEYYELWFGKEKGRMSAGTFKVDADGRVTLHTSVPEDAREYQRVGITLEKFPEEPRMSSAKVILAGELEGS